MYLFTEKFQDKHLQEDYLFQKKARESLSEMRIFSALQLFSMQGPHVIRKTSFVSTHQKTKTPLRKKITAAVRGVSKRNF